MPRAGERAASATVTSIARADAVADDVGIAAEAPCRGDDVLDHHRLDPVDRIVAASFDAWGMSAQRHLADHRR
jgi:hypothetical protein